MSHQDRRSFLKIAGMSIGAGAPFGVMPLFGREGTHELLEYLGEEERRSGHVGFDGPNGTKAFERAVEINALPSQIAQAGLRARRT